MFQQVTSCMIQSHNLPSQQSVKCYSLPTTLQLEQIRVSCFLHYRLRNEGMFIASTTTCYRFVYCIKKIKTSVSLLRSTSQNTFMHFSSCLNCNWKDIWLQKALHCQFHDIGGPQIAIPCCQTLENLVPLYTNDTYSTYKVLRDILNLNTELRNMRARTSIDEAEWSVLSSGRFTLGQH